MENYMEFVPAEMAQGPIMPDFIMSDERLSTGAMVVYMTLCSYSRNKSFCFPGKETLMHHARCSFNTLQKYLDQLIEYGYLKITKIAGRIFYYLFAPKRETQKNLHRSFIEVSKTETEVKELNNINTTPPTPSNVCGQKKLACVLNNVEGEFNKFWDCYPRKENKGFALTQFIKLKKKQLLPPFEYFKKAVRFFMDSKQWNRESGRFIPSLANFLANAKWEEVPMEYFAHKELSSHQREEQQAMEELRIKKASEAWEKEKACLRSNSLEKANSEDIETAWKVFTGKFKSEFGYMRAATRAKFMALYCSGFDFGVIEENKRITPAEFLKNMKKQTVR